MKEAMNDLQDWIKDTAIVEYDEDWDNINEELENY